MTEINSFLLLRKYTQNEILIFKNYNEKKDKKILISNKNNIYNNVFGKKKIEGITKKEATKLLLEYKNFLLGNITEEKHIRKFRDSELREIEKKNRLDKNSLLEHKLFYKSRLNKILGDKYLGVWSAILKETYKNQLFKEKLNFSQKEKIYVNCCIESYHYSQQNKKYRPKSFIDPVSNTIYEYLDDLSDINRSIWVNNEKNIFRKNTVIIAYRGTGVAESIKEFSILGNGKRDMYLDSLIVRGIISDSIEIKEIINDFINIHKIFGKTYKFCITGHSLGGRLAFEIHRKKYKLVDECRVFNVAFGYDIKYLKDVKLAQKQDFLWEKGLYTYHIGGILKKPEDDDSISVLSGGYGKSYTYYKNFKPYGEGHDILNFVEKK